MKSLNNDDIHAFLLAVEQQSITEAARRLGLSKSVISKRISDLERLLGVQLLMRSTRNVMPTEAGRIFYEAASESMRRLLEVAEDVAERSHGLCGELRITSPVSLTRLWLGPAIAKFAAAHPHLRVTLETDDRVVNIETERFDVAIRSARLPDSTLIARRIGSCARVVVCSPEYRAQYGEPHTIDQLTGHRCLNYSTAAPSATWTFAPDGGAGKPRAVSPRSAFLSNNGEALCDAAIQGIGIAMLPLYIADEALRDGRLVRVLAHESPQDEVVYAVYPRSPFTSNKLKQFIEHARIALLDPPSRSRDDNDARADTAPADLI
ncbi:LysR family transcriptional regulator [Burkholderia multivorans]|uniref:LysR family transcriptional regulator n=1 Tax=Burkholderia multivorans TaxID=87883 RepID=UPI000D009923|nr:LysR family transcriptional regulator [Burkholderia multivorans]MBU9163852.1 LysR family transcriptional regulator [Burkholderia multivorans]MBU9491517.1 LysR family transcriptional regulator [Burkholderia multivorans]MBU9543832.1 LysR family transcriptional regulator [Burkholderia multivorans]MCA8176703.1 LysR family transcriptional regulator [Burkholderia multivorans]MCO8589247.1 LysR family transcriptional regulator [Burkholderia multivorans]